MSALVAILLLLLVPALMQAVDWLRRRRNYQWLMAMLGALLAWPAVYYTRLSLPLSIAPLIWQPEDLFPTSPALLIDETSWVFAITLATLLLAVMLTSIARLRRTSAPQPDTQPQGGDPQSPSSDQDTAETPSSAQSSAQGANWRAWAGSLTLTSLGLVAVLSGNLLTLLLAWAALDIVELLMILRQVTTAPEKRQVTFSFSARIAGIALFMLAGIIIWSQGGTLTYQSISPQASLVLLLSAGLRLGLLPLHIPLTNELSLRRGLGTMLRLVPVAASLILIVRTAETGISAPASLILLGFTALAGLYGGVGWLRASDELSGRPYWILAVTSLALASAIQAQPLASLSWSLAALIPGSLLFLSSLRRRFLAPILLISALCLTGLPFTPTWAGTLVIQAPPASAGLLELILSYLWSLAFFIIHALTLAGYLHHSLRGIFIPSQEAQPPVERWVWLLYPLGLVILPVLHLSLGFTLQPDPAQASLLLWIEGAAALALAAAIWYYRLQPGRRPWSAGLPRGERKWLSSEIFYRIVEGLLRLGSQVTRLISAVLEGEAGILWALVVLALLLVFLQR